MSSRVETHSLLQVLLPKAPEPCTWGRTTLSVEHWAKSVVRHLEDLVLFAEHYKRLIV